MEEHAEADNGSIDQQTAHYRHDHCFDANKIRVSKNNREGYQRSAEVRWETKKRRASLNKHTHAHYNQEASKEASQIKHSRARALDKVIGVGAPAADPVGNRSEHICSDDEQREVRLVQGAGQNDEEEADCEDEGEGDDGL